MKKILLFSLFAMLFSYYSSGQSIKFEIPIQATGTVVDIDDGDTLVFVGSSDDAEQEHDEVDTPWDDDIDAGWEGEPEDLLILTAGMRFRDIYIPKGATIDSAFIIVHSHEGKNDYDVAKIRIFAEASDFAETYDSANFNADYLITERPRTDDSVCWIVDEEWIIWQSYSTPDLKDLVQEVIDRPGWETGNPIAFMFIGEDQGVTDTLENAREWEAFENIADPDDSAPDGTPGDGQNHPERIPRFLVYYTPPQDAQFIFSTPIVSTGTVVDIDDGDTLVFVGSSDDAEQEHDEVDTPWDDDIDAGWEGEPEDLLILTAGMRFQNITIPKGAVIDSAFITVHSHEGKHDYDVARIKIFAEASDFAETYDSAHFNADNLITDRPRTNDSVYWIVDEEWIIWQPYSTPDLGKLVQEVIDRPGWETGNPVAFMLIGEDQGVTDTIENAREWEAFENIADPDDSAPDGTPGDGQNHPERIPRLTVYYRLGGTSAASQIKEFTRGNLIYPNPTHGELNLLFESEGLKVINIHTITGKLVKTLRTSDMQINLDLGELEKGIYLVRTLSHKGSFTQKVLIR